MDEFVISLFHHGCIKFGEFVLKSGNTSPVYVDLRSIISYPDDLKMLALIVIGRIALANIEYDRICGVPYAALPFATVVAINSDSAMIMKRKEAKSYGTKQLIEGNFNKGDKVLVIEDVLSTGASIMETIKDLESAGLVVRDIIVVISRGMEAVQALKEKGYNVHYLFSIDQIAETLEANHLLSKEEVMVIKQASKFTLNSLAAPPAKTHRFKVPFEKRAEMSKCPATARLFKLMAKKKSNLCVAADYSRFDDIVALAEKIGCHICVLKLHMDGIEDSSFDFDRLTGLAKKLDFLIMEDRKLSDIGNAVLMQCNRIKKFTPPHLITAHPGIGTLDAVKKVFDGKNHNVGVFLVAEMSSDSLINADIEKTVNLAHSHNRLVAGFVCQSPNIFEDPGILQMTPGIHFSQEGDSLGQKYKSPEMAVLESGADVVIVGRGIVAEKNVAEKANLYRTKAWDAYIQRLDR